MTSSPPAVGVMDAWPRSRDEFASLVDRHVPRVFPGAAREWKPCRLSTEDTLAWLITLVGSRSVPVSVGLPIDSGRVAMDVADRKSIKTVLSGQQIFSKLASDILAELSHPTGHPLCMLSVKVDAVLPELRPFLSLPLDHLPSRGGTWRAWLGTGNHHVGVHSDGEENFFCLIAGRKRFTLFPPDTLPFLYVGALEGSGYGPTMSVVHPLEPDPLRYPLYAEAMARAVAVDLHPGDVLYLPANWWHYVESFGFNFSANYWWRHIPEAQEEEARSLFLQALLTIRSLPSYYQHYYKAIVDHFIFRTNGDPYSHLPPEHQGYAGEPTAENVASLRRLLNECNTRKRRAHVEEGALDREYTLHPFLTIRVDSARSISLWDESRGRDTTWPLAVLPTLARCKAGLSARDVLAHMERNGFQKDAAENTLVALVTKGILLPSD
jgi:hypothetical protein